MADPKFILRSLYYHLVLPPRLPGREADWTLQAQLAEELFRRVIDAARELKDAAPEQYANTYDALIASLSTSETINATEATRRRNLEAAFRNLSPFRPLIVHVFQQNAGLLIWRHQQPACSSETQPSPAVVATAIPNVRDIVVFEAFESSPRSEDVMSADGALRIVFPGSSNAMPFSDFQDSTFQCNLAQFVDLACHERVARFSARTRKAQASVIEPRDTTNPELVTTWLATLIEANGCSVTISPIAKRVKDDICWAEGARAPWRRMPCYLVLRVGLRRSFQLSLGDEGKLHYKLLITKVLSNLLRDLAGKVSWETLAFMRAKVCRRMAKLEELCENAPPNFRALLQGSSPSIWQQVSAMSSGLEIAWRLYKQRSRRFIEPLMSRFAPPSALQQDMSSSRTRLSQLVRLFEQESSSFASRQLTLDDIHLFMTTYDKYTKTFLDLAESEEKQRELAIPPMSHSKLACSTLCCDLSREIIKYVDQVYKHYIHFTELLSNSLLNLMDLWTALDQCALIVFPLLKEFKPIFSANILDVLHVASWEDMCRLHRIQSHLTSRHSSASSVYTIFQDPVKGCFAERFFDASPQMQDKMREIEAEAAQKRAAKEEELSDMMKQRREMEAERSLKGCILLTAEDSRAEQLHKRRHCPRCKLQDELRRQRIAVHEHPLPRNPSQAKAIVFEICLPEGFASYREAGWSIMKYLVLHQDDRRETDPGTILREFPPLQSWVTDSNSTIGLASEKKSFMLSHWKDVSLPAKCDDVCLPCGIEPIYFDINARLTLRSIGKDSTFSRWLGLKIPAQSPFNFVLGNQDFALDSDGPSSNKIISSQAKCPASLSVHEYLSFQALFSGAARRWPLILMELGSSNLNFSNEACAKLLSTITVLAGPTDSDNSVVRVIHKELLEDTFCKQILVQIAGRLQSIGSNWRDTNCMGMLVDLILRILVLCPASAAPEALRTLNIARNCLSRWMRALITELEQATSLEATRTCSTYVLRAALTCRRTFSVFIKSNFSWCSGSSTIPPLDETGLQIYALASISMQNSVKELTKSMPSDFLEPIFQDRLLVSKLYPMLVDAFRSYPKAVTAALCDIGILPYRSPQTIHILPPPHQSWAEMVLTPPAAWVRPQLLQINILAGHVLIDGKPQGKLSEDFRSSPILVELFGTSNLYAVSSSLPGMSYRLTVSPQRNEIHVGLRNGIVVVRVCNQNRVWEILDRQIFQTAGNTIDLPYSLIHDCIPFLDLRSHVVELRRKAGNPWMLFNSDWRLNMKSWKVTRSTRTRNFTLVNYNGRYYARVLSTFLNFEDPARILVYQPSQGPLEVELRRLELKFFLNSRALFESQKLGLEISIDQDAGFFYGLKSSLVVQDVKNSTNRYVLVPFGPPVWHLRGMHPEIMIQNNGDYARYAIDPILGRLSSPAQPRLLYRKALMHALTSFIVPDPLTGRTGTEEAMCILKSGACQPSFPLETPSIDELRALRDLVPRREFYPIQPECMQKVDWKDTLTASSQHDGILQLVDEIIESSNTLCTVLSGGEAVVQGPEASRRLIMRGIMQRARFERANAISENLRTPEDAEYAARHLVRCSTHQENIRYLAQLIRSWPSSLALPQNFAKIFERYDRLGGFTDPFSGMVSLSSCMELDESLSLGCMVEYCRRTTREKRYDMLFVIALAAYKSFDMDVVIFWLAFAFFEGLKAIKAPHWESYSQFRIHQHPHVPGVIRLLNCIPGATSTEISVQPYGRQSGFQLAPAYDDDHTTVDVEKFAQHVVDQFPCQVLDSGPYTHVARAKIRAAMDVLEPEFLRLFQNLQLSDFFDRVQIALQDYQSYVTLPPPGQWIRREKGVATWSAPRLAMMTTRYLFDSASAALQKNYKADQDSNAAASKPRVSELSKFPEKHIVRSVTQKPKVRAESSEAKELRTIFQNLAQSDSRMMQQYIGDLLQSLEAFCNVEARQGTLNASQKSNVTTFSSHEGVKTDVEESYHSLRLALLSRHGRVADWLTHGALLPCMSPLNLLEQLRPRSGVQRASVLRNLLVRYGVAMTRHQRLLRIIDARLKNNHRKASEEQTNLGHTNWSPAKHPDWLLIELDGNILIRSEQVIVALATISPSSGENSLLQMNMGQGKTSVVIPMVAAELADTKNLARILVPRQLLHTTVTLLQSRLGGLVGRDICHLPYSRRTDPSKAVTRVYFDIQNQARKRAAIFVAAPEHILSFKLCGLQHLSDGRLEEAEPMMKVQHWFDMHARDVVDESDFVFSPRTALCFPSGSQTIVDGHPYRWRIIEALLELVESNVTSLQHELPGSIEVVDRQNAGFPFVFFLRRHVEDELLARIALQVLGQRPLFPIQAYNRLEIEHVKDFISNHRPSEEAIQFVKTIAPEQPEIKKIIHLLRGLIVHRILLLTLKKRWNVQYGVDPRRDPIAVPFSAKGVPSDQSEWGHPDVAILFTILAHYYSGLTFEQVRQILVLVGQSDDPARTYQVLVHACTNLRGTFRDWEAINTDDRDQLSAIWQDVRFNTGAIDYYLNNFVFPRHAKQFRIKLQASGWDIPLFSPTAQSWARSLTTGFSGTNDNRRILPLTIQQHDLPLLAHTSAEVLTYLLQPRNRSFHVATSLSGRRMTEVELLRRLGHLGIRVLLDAGAQILEMSNEQVAETWLQIDSTAPAAVYFDTQDIAMVRYRQGTRLPLLVSPFAEDLSEVLVYIDESHCRGTDLMLPDNARGALTLGMSLQKDTLIQSAMRLRQLGTTQSVAFFAPPEVHQSILDVVRLSPHQKLDSSHIVHWLLHSTCEQLESLSPLFYSHGMDFCRRMQGTLENSDLQDEDQRSEYLRILRQQERQSLTRLYEPKNKAHGTEGQSVTYSAPRLKAFVKELSARRKAFQDTGNAVHASALQEVEQEREIEVEVQVEKVRESQRPNWYQPYAFDRLDHYICKFVATGHLPPRQSAGYQHMFDFIKRTAAGKRHNVTKPREYSSLFLTREFALTVQCPHNRPDDSFLRPVQWLLWSCISSEALLLSPEEAEVITPLLRMAQKEQGVSVHLLTYSAPVTRKMLHFNDLSYYAIPHLLDKYEIPAWLKVEVGFFAGRLYFEWHEYHDILRFLGLEPETVETRPFTTACPEGSTSLNGESIAHENSCQKFTTRPLAFLEDWISSRRKMQDWSSSPMGFIVAGKKLHASHAFFSGHCRTVEEETKVAYVAEAEEKRDDDEDEDDDIFYDANDQAVGGAEVDWDDRKSDDEE